MSQLLDLIFQAEAEQVDFANDALETAFETQSKAFAEMVQAVTVVERAAETAGVDVQEVATNVVELAVALGVPYRKADAAGREKIQKNFAGLYAAGDPNVEAAVETIFNKVLDHYDATITLNEWVAANVTDPGTGETRQARRK